MMAKAIRMTRTGGPEVLDYVDVVVGEPGPGEARVRQHAAHGLHGEREADHHHHPRRRA